ncbi:hypothetical protein QUF74_03425 [Candidatus Halobeggiatoa sp. HSG11]|nr:hypothetical protein [Candidatus Halobeggiatoa sp. HSG11]
MIKLDEEEQGILEAFEVGEFKSDMIPARKIFIEQSADYTFRKSKRIKIEILEQDFTVLERKSLEEGMSYQTLIASVIHKYISGSLCDVTVNKQPSAKRWEGREK